MGSLCPYTLTPPSLLVLLLSPGSSLTSCLEANIVFSLFYFDILYPLFLNHTLNAFFVIFPFPHSFSVPYIIVCLPFFFYFPLHCPIPFSSFFHTPFCLNNFLIFLFKLIFFFYYFTKRPPPLKDSSVEKYFLITLFTLKQKKTPNFSLNRWSHNSLGYNKNTLKINTKQNKTKILMRLTVIMRLLPTKKKKN